MDSPEAQKAKRLEGSGALGTNSSVKAPSISMVVEEFSEG